MEIKDYNVLIEERNFFDQPIKNDLKMYDNIRKITTSQVNDYTTGCLLDYPCFLKKLEINFNRFKQTTKTRCSNTR